MGAAEVEAFLSSLATQRGVSAAMHNQALCAPLLLYKQVLSVEIGWVDGVTRAKRPERVPVVMSHVFAAWRIGGAQPGGCVTGRFAHARLGGGLTTDMPKGGSGWTSAWTTGGADWSPPSPSGRLKSAYPGPRRG